MPDRELKYKITYEEDKQSLVNLSKAQGQALGGNSNQPTAVDRSIVQAKKLEDRFKILQDAQKQLAAQPGMERSLAKVNQELAGVYGSQKRITTSVGDYLKNLEKEVALRKEARNLINNSEGGYNQFSAHSQRQMQYLQQMIGKAPGGSVFNQFINGSTRAAAAAESSGAGSAMQAASGLGGGALAAGAAAAAAAISALVGEFNMLMSRANELAQSTNNLSSGLGSLRVSNEQRNINTDINANTPGVINLAKLKDTILKGLGDFASHSSSTKEERDKAAADALKNGLGGQSGEDWRRIKEAGQDLQVDLSIQKQALDENAFRKQRDYELELRSFAIDTGRQKQDLDKQRFRTDQDFQIASQKYQEQFANQQSAKQFAMQQQFAQQAYQLQQKYQIQDYTRSAGYQSADFARNQQYQSQDLKLNRKYQAQDYGESLQRAIMGGANGMDIYWLSHDYQKQQQRETEQFNISRKRETEQFNITQQRDKETLGINLGRGAEQYGLSQQQALAGRQLEVESQLYARKYEGLELELQHNRALEDLNTQYERLAQNVSLQKERFANQGRDMQYDINKSYSDFNLQAMRANRAQGYSEEDFANQMRLTNPVGAVGQAAKDAQFAQALARGGQKTGAPDLIGLYNQTRQESENSLGGKLGDLFKKVVTDTLQQTLDGLNPDKNPNWWSLNPFDWFKSTPKSSAPTNPTNEFDKLYQADLAGKGPNDKQPAVLIQTGGNSFQLDPGLAVSIQKYVDEQDQKTRQHVEDLIKSYYTG